MEATARMGFWSPRRFGQLLLRELVTGYRSLLIAMAAVGGALIVVTLLTSLGMTLGGIYARAGAAEYYGSFFRNLLFIGGFVVTSLAFREIWNNGGGIFYLTIPGSIFEKFTSKLLVTSLGYAVGSTIFFTAAAAAAEGITLLVFGMGHGFFNPFELQVLQSLLIYVLVQSVFLLGSIWFRKLALMKTILWSVIFVVALGIIAAVAVRIFLADHMVWHTVQGGVTVGGWSMDLSNVRLERVFGPYTKAYAGLMVFRAIGTVLLWTAAPVMWLAGYFRLREVEV